MLELLLAADGAIVSRRGAAEPRLGRVRRPVQRTSCKVTISRLRRKLGEPPVIETVPHAGYRIWA